MRDTQFRTRLYFAHKHSYFRRSPAQQYNYMIKKKYRLLKRGKSRHITIPIF